ncbi:MAG: hypothetical protein AB1476_02590 [Candidatus Hadarchaeota archaeon]
MHTRIKSSEENRRWITVYIELPADFGVENIMVGTVALEGEALMEGALSAELQPAEVRDHDNDGIPDLMVKFDRAAVQELVEVGESVELTVIGRWGEAPFRGSGNIRVIDPGQDSDKAQSHSNRPATPPGQSGGNAGQGPPSTPPGQGGTPPGQSSDQSQGNGGEQGNQGQGSGQNGQSGGQGNPGGQGNGQSRGNQGQGNSGNKNNG